MSAVDLIPIRASIRPGASRRQVLTGATGVAASFALAGAAEADESADFLFVQTAREMAFDADQNRLTLRGVSPVTLFFSDRPERVAGNMPTTKFVPFWSEGSDSFLSDPPNADLSILENGALRQTVVVLRAPALEGEDLHYTVQILDGDMPVLGEAVSLFIDVIGMPLTPVSYAGVARRSFRRAAIY
jgi:hypothetical protein